MAKGYLAEDRSGNFMELNLALGIGANSDNKEIAWDFISYFLTDVVEYEMEEHGFTTRED